MYGVDCEVEIVIEIVCIVWLVGEYVEVWIFLNLIVEDCLFNDFKVVYFDEVFMFFEWDSVVVVFDFVCKVVFVKDVVFWCVCVVEFFGKFEWYDEVVFEL